MDIHECERGNTWLEDPDSSNHYALIDIGDCFLEVCIQCENYPGFHVNTINDKSQEELAAHVNERYAGWYVRKCNLPGVTIVDGHVSAG